VYSITREWDFVQLMIYRLQILSVVLENPRMPYGWSTKLWTQYDSSLVLATSFAVLL